MNDDMIKPQVRKKYYARMMDTYRESPVHIPYLNALMRYTLTTKARRNIRRIKKEYADSDDIIERWFGQRKTVFFGLGFFRSGTTFLADFLNKSVSDVIVQHEPNLIDYYYYATAIQNPAGTYAYIKDYRLREIYNRMLYYGIKGYGEINPFLGRHCIALKQYCPDAKQFHLVRDGRDVLRSLMSRKFFGTNHFWTPLIQPPQEDAYFEKWGELSRFEKICWLWKSDNEYLRNNVEHLVQFEKLLSDYDYFKLAIIDYLDIENIDADVWQKSVSKTKNETPVHSFPHFNNWDDNEKKIFEKTCGEEMFKLGYQIV